MKENDLSLKGSHESTGTYCVISSQKKKKIPILSASYYSMFPITNPPGRYQSYTCSTCADTLLMRKIYIRGYCVICLLAKSASPLKHPPGRIKRFLTQSQVWDQTIKSFVFCFWPRCLPTLSPGSTCSYVVAPSVPSILLSPSLQNNSWLGVCVLDWSTSSPGIYSLFLSHYLPLHSESLLMIAVYSTRWETT